VFQGHALLEYENPAVAVSACSGLNGIRVGEHALLVRMASPKDEAPVAKPQSASAATPVLVLLNMVTASELQSDTEYADILDDIGQELAKFGTVRSVTIPRQGPAVGKVRECWDVCTHDVVQLTPNVRCCCCCCCCCWSADGAGVRRVRNK